MANEIQCAHTATGKNLYALIRNSTGSVWNGSSFVSYATANLSTYAISLTEQGTASRHYTATFSASITAGFFAITVFERQGASPAEGDPLAAAGNIEWDGTNVCYLASRPSASDYTAARATKLDNLDATISSRGNATAANQTTIIGYVDDLETRLTATRALLLDNLDTTISSRLPTSSYTAPDNTGISAIKTQTDKFSFDGSNYVNAHDKTNDDKSGYSLTSTEENAIADALLDRSNGIETSYTLRQALRIVLSALAGKLSGAASTSVTIRDVGDAKDRITATVDSDGNRTAMTLDAS